MRFEACLGIALVAVVTGCSVTTSSPDNGPPPPVVTPATGTLTVDWTINGQKDPNQCNQGAAAAIEITVTADNGAPVGTYQQSCTAFATSITLDAGHYAATAHLVDVAGNPRTTDVNINPFTILGNDDLNTPIDFSASSFF